MSSVTIENTSNWNTFDSSYAYTNIDVTGVHDLYFSFTGTSGTYLYNIDSFQFLETTCDLSSYEITNTIEAEDYCDMFGIEGDLAVTHVQNGDWVRYSNFDFGSEGTNVFSFSASSTTSGGTIELRSGSVTGTLLGSVNVSGTGNWSTYEDYEGNITEPVTGIHDLYLVFVGGSGYLFNVDNFIFSYDETLSNLNYTLNDFKIQIYPNPVTDYLHIDGVEDLIELSLYDLRGNLIKTETGKSVIDVSNIASGIYFLQIHTPQKSFMKKIIKQ